MYRETPEYKDWKAQMADVLDSLVAAHFEQLYTRHDADRLDVWGEIARELYARFDLTEIKETDPEYRLKKKKENCIYVSLRIYLEKEFPHELNDERTFRFVTTSGKLPSQAPEEWASFEIDQRLAEARRREALDARLDEYIRLRDAGLIHSS